MLICYYCVRQYNSTLKGNRCTFRADNFVKRVLVSHLKRGQHLMEIKNSLLLEWTLFQKWLPVQESKREVVKVVYLAMEYLENKYFCSLN